MSITLNQIYSWKVKDGSHFFSYPYDFLDGLKVLSLDACAPFYRHLLLPLSFNARCKGVLQKILGTYDRSSLQSDKDNEKYLLFVFNEMENNIGLAKTLDIGEWLGASSHRATEDFEKNLEYIIKNISEGRINDEIPIRIERYFAMRELLADNLGYEWDAQLEPSELNSSWDRKIYMAQVSADPEDQHNYWNPSASAYLRSSCMCTRISLENSMNNPTPDALEIEKINSWIDAHVLQRFELGGERRPVDIAEVFLRPHLKREYLQQGLIFA